MEDDQKIEVTDEIMERVKLAYKLSKEIVETLKFLDIKENQTEQYDHTKHYIYKIDNGEDVSIYTKIATIFGHINFSFSLSNIAYDAIWLIQLMLTDERKPEMLKPSVIYELEKRNIDVLTLFDLNETEVQEVVELHTKGVIGMFLENLPNFTSAAVVDSYGHSKLGYYHHHIKPMVEEHWKKLGLPDDFELVTQDQLDEVRKYDLGRKRWFLGDKKQLLTEAIIRELADEADRLRELYKIAKVRYLSLKTSFFDLNRNGKNAEWQEKWMELVVEEFPNLFSASSDKLEELRPFELACNHLANIFDYDDESMKKKIAISRKIRGQRNKKGVKF